jgi:hypothetical protein
MIRRLRDRLTYANVTATLAVFIALGGTSYAALSLPRNSVGSRQIRAGAVRSSELKDRSVRLRDVSVSARKSLRGAVGPAGAPGAQGAPAAKYFAVMNANGTLARGNATSGGSGGSPGSYVVGFADRVSACAYTATVGSADGSAVPAGRATVRESDGRVAVQTVDSAGNATDLPFHLIVAC